MRCGQHPTWGDENAVSFPWHVHQRREVGSFDAVPAIFDIITDDDGPGSERESGKQQKEPAIHRKHSSKWSIDPARPDASTLLMEPIPAVADERKAAVHENLAHFTG